MNNRFGSTGTGVPWDGNTGYGAVLGTRIYPAPFDDMNRPVTHCVAFFETDQTKRLRNAPKGYFSAGARQLAAKFIRIAIEPRAPPLAIPIPRFKGEAHDANAG